MRDPNRQIREAYYQTFTGNVDFNGNAVTTWDSLMLPQGEYPAIVLTEQTNADLNDVKNCEHYEPTILVRVINKEEFGQDGVDTIAEQVYLLVETVKGYTMDNFIFTGIYLESDFTLPPFQADDSTPVISRDIRFRNTITLN